jgi:radical SAM superfamily enzyme YgiQ (UPF0313 family)
LAFDCNIVIIKKIIEWSESLKKVVWVTLNAKYMHTSLALRYLREACKGICHTDILELTINNSLQDMLGQIYETHPDIIGFACYIWNIEQIKQILHLLPKALPYTKMICGGPEVSYGTEDFLRECPMVDYVVRGEGEIVLPQLLLYMLRGAENCGIPGIAFLKENGEFYDGGLTAVNVLQELPFAYRAEEIESLREHILYYETSRGCPFSCAYCLSCASSGVRYLPVERVLRELDFFIQHRVRQVKFVDRTFNANKIHFLPILKFIAGQKCRTNFHFEMAIDYLDDEVLDVLQRMPKGRVQLEIGIQSTNLLTLQKVSRINHWDKIAANIHKILSFNNMHVHVDIIIGLPEEDLHSFSHSFNEIYALHADMLQLGFLKFLKGARMMRLAAEGTYAYMDMAPYTVLSNRWLSYGEIYWLQGFESVFAYYYNAGRCRKTTEYFICAFEHKDAFSFYRKLTDYWRIHKYHSIAHTTKALYGHLLDFCQTMYNVPTELVDSLLRFDALTTDGGRIRPEVLQWSQEKYKKEIHFFWHNDEVKKYIPDYSFTNWRDVHQNYCVEIFPFSVESCAHTSVMRKTTALLFVFCQGSVSYKDLALEDLDIQDF